MRISDWSSDVCSSDLDQVPAAAWPYGRESFAGPLQSGFRPVHQESRNRRAVAPGESNSAPTDLPDSRDAPVQPATGLQRSRRAHRKFPGSDRKSVVSGKSVSVRVDLGGRGILKKKKT